MNYNTLIIVGTSGVIIALLLLLGARHLVQVSHEDEGGFSSKAKGFSSSLDAEKMEALLEQVLSKTASFSGVTDAQNLNAHIGPEALKEVQSLKDELKKKQEEIEIVKKQAQSVNPEEKQKFQEQVQGLEARLSEYEIIAEDIADLSRFKEENSELKKKIAQLETSLASASVVPASVTESVTSSESVTASGSSLSSESSGNVVDGDAIDDDLMAEFQRAIEEQRKQSQEAKAASPLAQKIEALNGGAGLEPSASPTVESAPRSPESSSLSPLGSLEPEAIVNAVTDVQTKNPSDSSTENSSLAESVDLSSILNEASHLKEPALDSDVVNSLDQELNADLLAAEASSLGEIKAEDIELMNNFESFVKGR
jgi:hypothetical protein